MNIHHTTVKPHLIRQQVMQPTGFPVRFAAQATADVVDVTIPEVKVSLLDNTPTHQRYEDELNEMLSSFGLKDVLNWDHNKKPPLPVLKAIVEKRMFVAGVPLPKVEEGRSFLNDASFTDTIGVEHTEALQTMIKEGIPQETFQFLQDIGRDGHAKSLVMASKAFAKELSVGVATFLGVNTGLSAETISKMGTPEQQTMWLNALNSGVFTYGFGLTEAGVGSNPADMKTTYEKVEQNGQTFYKLNGDKKFIGNAARVVDEQGNVIHRGADFLAVFAVDDPNKPPREREYRVFMVPRTLIGEDNIEHTGGELNKMGLREVNNGDFKLKNVMLPEVFLLGDPDENIYKKMLGLLDETRLCVGAMALGTAEAALDKAEQYIKERVQNGEVIENFQAVSMPIERLRAKAAATKLLILHSANLIDQAAKDKADGKETKRFGTETAMAKLYASELAVEASLQAIAAHGGRGYLEETGLPKRLRDAIVTTIYEGTSDVNRNVICAGTLGTEKKRLNKSKVRQLRFFLLSKRWSQKGAYNIGKKLSYWMGKLRSKASGSTSERSAAIGLIDAAYRMTAADVMLKFYPTYKNVVKNWTEKGKLPEEFKTWDQKSIERAAALKASLPYQIRMHRVADIAVINTMARLVKKQLSEFITQEKKGSLSPEDKQVQADLSLFLKMAVGDAQAHARRFYSWDLKHQEEQFNKRVKVL